MLTVTDVPMHPTESDPIPYPPLDYSGHTSPESKIHPPLNTPTTNEKTTP